MIDTSCHFCESEDKHCNFKTFYNKGLKCYNIACLECYKKQKLYRSDRSPGWVYLIGFDDFWKCGFTTTSPTARHLAIQLSNPHEVSILQAWRVGDCKLAEKLAHAKLAKFHFRGEWFDCDPDELLTILNVMFLNAEKYRPD